jgi:hypothetical protein
MLPLFITIISRVINIAAIISQPAIIEGLRHYAIFAIGFSLLLRFQLLFIIAGRRS